MLLPGCLCKVCDVSHCSVGFDLRFGFAVPQRTKHLLLPGFACKVSNVTVAL
jgi:hypothetical protein